MSNPIRDIVDHLNGLIETGLNLSGVCLYGLTELVETKGHVFPVPEFQDHSKRIYPDSKFPLQLYWRLSGPVSEAEAPQSFGKARDKRTTAVLSLYGIGDQSQILKQRDGINVDVAYEVNSLLPVVNFDVSDNIPLAFIQSPSLVTDKDAIFQTEFRGNGAMPRLKLNLIAFRIDLTVIADRCELCPS